MTQSSQPSQSQLSLQPGQGSPGSALTITLQQEKERFLAKLIVRNNEDSEDEFNPTLEAMETEIKPKVLLTLSCRIRLNAVTLLSIAEMTHK